MVATRKEWEASVKSRTVNGTGCPYCSHNKVLAGFNDLASQYPNIAAEWSDRNLPLLPTMVTAFANSKACDTSVIMSASGFVIMFCIPFFLDEKTYERIFRENSYEEI